MALTDFADVYAALHDAGINRVLKHFMRQRPSLFNYGTENIRRNPGLLCTPITADPGVTRLLTVLDPVPIMGINHLGLDFFVQLTDFTFEFFPSNTMTLPAELNPLTSQHFAIKISACAGISCIPKAILDSIRPDFGFPGTFGTLRRLDSRTKSRTTYIPARAQLMGSFRAAPAGSVSLRTTRTAGTSGAIRSAEATGIAGIAGISSGRITGRDILTIPDILVIPPVEKPQCFCLSVYVTGNIRIDGTPPNQTLATDIEKIEIADISPGGLENIIECYLRLVLEKAVLPQVLPGVAELLFSPVSLGTAGELLFSASTTAPHNPAVEDNQLKVHVNLDSINLALPEPEESAEPWPEPDVRYIRTRNRTDAFDLTVAVNETTLRELFQVIGNQFTWSLYDSGAWGPLSASYGIAVSVHDCDLELRSDHQLTVSFSIDVDTLFLDFGIDIPEISIPGFCLVPPGFPHDWCAVWIPGTSFFGANPDITLPLDISGILSIALALTATPVVYYGEGTPNRWMLFIDPDPSLTSFNIDGINEIPGTLLENAIDAAIASLGLPDWAEDVIEAILGPLVDVIKGILSITGDVALWIIDFIGNTLGLWDLLKTVLLEYLGSTVSLFQLPDPLPILPAETPEIEVKLPISYLEATVNATELILQADIGEEV